MVIPTYGRVKRNATSETAESVPDLKKRDLKALSKLEKRVESTPLPTRIHE